MLVLVLHNIVRYVFGNYDKKTRQTAHMMFLRRLPV